MPRPRRKHKRFCWALPSIGFRVCTGFRVQGLGFRVQGSGFRIGGSGFRVRRGLESRLLSLAKTEESLRVSLG